ncbi:TIMELESS-interacting protein [Thunnus thynnus]|uniref:TIMELESS-interacting protein n=1 Tax=Thunnus thynnus TaxID=8237 RepID=UPI003527566C
MVKQQKNGLHDVSDYDGMEDEAFPPLPPPQSPGLGGEDGGDPFTNGEEEGDVSKLAEVPAAKRKGVKRPQPKLDSNRLTSERGLPALRTLFDNVHFKGKGHEAENLRLLMQKMENWAHRLFPKLQFEDFIDKVEKLGNKKEVQTCLKRIRLDMPLTHEDFMGEEDAAPESNIFGDPDPFSRGSFPDELIHSTPAPAAPPTPAAAPSPAATSPTAPSLTEEQRQRMELNRRRALERRLARQQQQTDPTDSRPADSSLSADEPSSVSSSNVLNDSKHQQEDEEEDEEGFNPQPISSSTQQPDQLSPKDSEPSEPPTQSETTETRTSTSTSTSPVHQPSNDCEEED